MATRRIFLHIGAIKTGTTYIQTVLRENRERLIEEGVLFPGARWRSQVRAVEDVLRLSKRRDGRPMPTPRPWPGLVEEIRSFGGDTAVVSMEWLSYARPAQVRSIVSSLAPPRSGRCSRSGTRRPPCRRSGRPACTTDRRSRGPGSPVGSEPRRASRRPRRGTRRWWGHGCSPAPRTPATSCGHGRGSWERRGSTWSRCLPRGSRRSCCGRGSRRRSGSLRSCAGRRSHRPTRPWDWRRPSCFGW